MRLECCISSGADYRTDSVILSIASKYYGRPARGQAVSGATAATTVYITIGIVARWFGRSPRVITVDFCQVLK